MEHGVGSEGRGGGQIQIGQRQLGIYIENRESRIQNQASNIFLVQFVFLQQRIIIFVCNDSKNKKTISARGDLLNVAFPGFCSRPAVETGRE